MGVYEAAHPTQLGAKEISPLAQYLCEQVNDRLPSKDGVFICLKPNMPASASDEMPLNEFLAENTTGLQVKHFSIGAQNGSIQIIAPEKVSSMDNKYRDSSNVLKEFVFDKNHSYLQLADFDDHLADVSRDWRN